MMLKKFGLMFILMSFILACSKGGGPAEERKETKYPIAFVETRLGQMYFWMYDETPHHKAKFIELAKAKHYNQFTFNRVVRNFVIQGGCPDSVKYFEGSPYLIDPEFVDTIKHVYGALGMGRNDNPGKQSNACQFYVVNYEKGLPKLDGNYMIFGKMIAGFDVLEKIEMEPTDKDDIPLTSIPLNVEIREFTKQELYDKFNFKIK